MNAYWPIIPEFRLAARVAMICNRKCSVVSQSFHRESTTGESAIVSHAKKWLSYCNSVQWRRNEFKSGAPISRFRDGQYSLSVSCLLLFYSRCPPCPAICKSGGTCPPFPSWSRRHWQCLQLSNILQEFSSNASTLFVVICEVLRGQVTRLSCDNAKCIDVASF